MSEKVRLHGENMPTSTEDWDPISCAVLETFHPLFCRHLNIKKRKYEIISQGN